MLPNRCRQRCVLHLLTAVAVTSAVRSALALYATADVCASGREEICGVYWREDGTGGWERMELQMDHLFTYERTEERSVRARGRWVREPESEVVSLDPALADGEPFPRMAARWQPIEWGERRYLVPEGRLIDFCNAVNLGREPRECEQGEFLLREGDWRLSAVTSPSVPTDWQALILKTPIRGRVTSFEEVEGMIMARLNVGGSSGLTSGMVLAAASGNAFRDCYVKVLCPCDDSARVQVLCPDDAESPGDLSLNDQVSTLEPFRFKEEAAWDALGLKIDRMTVPTPALRVAQSDDERRKVARATKFVERHHAVLQARISNAMEKQILLNVDKLDPTLLTALRTECSGAARFWSISAEHREVLFEWVWLAGPEDGSPKRQTHSSPEKAQVLESLAAVRIFISVDAADDRFKGIRTWVDPALRRAALPE